MGEWGGGGVLLEQTSGSYKAKGMSERIRIRGGEKCEREASGSGLSAHRAGGMEPGCHIVQTAKCTQRNLI